MIKLCHLRCYEETRIPATGSIDYMIYNQSNHSILEKMPLKEIHKTIIPSRVQSINAAISCDSLIQQ